MRIDHPLLCFLCSDRNFTKDSRVAFCALYLDQFSSFCFLFGSFLAMFFPFRSMTSGRFILFAFLPQFPPDFSFCLVLLCSVS